MLYIKIMLQYYTLPACSNLAFFLSFFFSKSVLLSANTQWHTLTHSGEHTGRSLSMSPHPDPRGRPVAACLKPNHLYRAREIAQSVCALQAGLGPCQPQPNSSGVFDDSYADQKGGRRHWTEGVVEENTPQAGSLPFYVISERRTSKRLRWKQCEQKHAAELVQKFGTQTDSCSLDSLPGYESWTQCSSV